MLNPERVDLINESAYNNNCKVEIEFTTENADSGLIIILDENSAMELANMIMAKCSYGAKLKRKKY